MLRGGKKGRKISRKLPEKELGGQVKNAGGGRLNGEVRMGEERP
jgi:hypothetical protein